MQDCDSPAWNWCSINGGKYTDGSCERSGSCVRPLLRRYGWFTIGTFPSVRCSTGLYISKLFSQQIISPHWCFDSLLTDENGKGSVEQVQALESADLVLVLMSPLRVTLKSGHCYPLYVWEPDYQTLEQIPYPTRHYTDFICGSWRWKHPFLPLERCPCAGGKDQ